MALADPELELLLLALEEDPADPQYVTVARELVARARHDEARRVLEGGVALTPLPEGVALLARVLLDLGEPEAALRQVDAAEQGELARVRLLALERLGRVADARSLALAMLMKDNRDPLPKEVLARLATPKPPATLRAADPAVTVARAERYVSAGRPDRALRAYRRILLRHPGEISVAARVRELEQTAPRAAPPRTRPPEPARLPTTPPRRSPSIVPLEPIQYDPQEDEVTLVGVRPKPGST